MASTIDTRGGGSAICVTNDCPTFEILGDPDPEPDNIADIHPMTNGIYSEHPTKIDMDVKEDKDSSSFPKDTSTTIVNANEEGGCTHADNTREMTSEATTSSKQNSNLEKLSEIKPDLGNVNVAIQKEHNSEDGDNVSRDSVPIPCTSPVSSALSFNKAPASQVEKSETHTHQQIDPSIGSASDVVPTDENAVAAGQPFHGVKLPHPAEHCASEAFPRASGLQFSRERQIFIVGKGNKEDTRLTQFSQMPAQGIPTSPFPQTISAQQFDQPSPFRTRAPEFSQYPSNGFQNRNRDEGARHHAQVLKLQQELSAERESKRNLRKTIEVEVRETSDAALLSMIKDVFHERSELEKQKYELQKKQVDLDRQAKWFSQLEVMLTEGQKLLQSQHREIRLRDPASIELEQVRQYVTDEKAAVYKNANAKLLIKHDLLRAREAKLDLMEQHWKTRARESLEDELRTKLEEEIEARIADSEYQRGFDQGKETGRLEKCENAQQQGFLEGYNMARLTQQRIAALEKGSIPYDSLDLDFLFNPEHPENPFNRGIQIGSFQVSEKVQKLRAVPKDAAQISNQETANLKDSLKISKAPASRPTIYEELNGSPARHNGHIILANGNSRGVNGISANGSGPSQLTPCADRNIGGPVRRHSSTFHEAPRQMSGNQHVINDGDDSLGKGFQNLIDLN